MLLCARQGVGLKTLAALVCCLNLRLNVAGLVVPLQATPMCAPSSLDPDFSLFLTRLNLVAGLVVRGGGGHLRRASSRKLVARQRSPPPVPQPTKLSREHQLRCEKRSACTVCALVAPRLKSGLHVPICRRAMVVVVRNTRAQPFWDRSESPLHDMPWLGGPPIFHTRVYHRIYTICDIGQARPRSRY